MLQFNLYIDRVQLTCYYFYERLMVCFQGQYSIDVSRGEEIFFDNFYLEYVGSISLVRRFFFGEDVGYVEMLKINWFQNFFSMKFFVEKEVVDFLQSIVEVEIFYYLEMEKIVFQMGVRLEFVQSRVELSL